MVVMVVMMSRRLPEFHGTLLIVAMLVFRFKLKGSVADTVFTQFFADFLFYLMGIRICDDVHGGIVVMTVHAPYMDMVNTENTVDFRYMMRDFVYICSVGSFFKEKINRFFKISDSVYKNKY